MAVNFDRKLRLPRIHFRVHIRAANMRHVNEPKKGVLRIFSPWKIQRLRPGLNPRTWVPKTSTLPLDHRSRFLGGKCSWCIGLTTFTTFMCQLFWNLGSSTSCSLNGLSRPYFLQKSSNTYINDNNVMNTTWLLCSKAVSSYHIGMRLLRSWFTGVLIEKLVDPWRGKPVPHFKITDQEYLSRSLSGIFRIHLMPELHLNTSATSMTITNRQNHKTQNLFKIAFSNYSFNWLCGKLVTPAITWCVQVLRSPTEAFAAAMQSWRERCEKCVCLQGDYVEKWLHFQLPVVSSFFK